MEHPISQHVADEANRLVEEGRVRLCYDRAADMPGAVVLGRHADYQTWLGPEGVSCDCRAGADHGWTEPRCSHAVAAMVVWREAMAGEPWHPNGWMG